MTIKNNFAYGNITHELEKSYDLTFESVCEAKMAMSILGFFFCLSILVHNGLGSGELDILHSPDSIKFQGHEHLKESLIKEVFSAALGFSVEQGSDWSGLVINDPFGSPEAVVGVFIDGITSLGNKAHLKSHRYPLTTDDNDWSIWESLERRIIQRFPEGGNKLININLSDGPEVVNEYKNVFGEINGKMGKFSLQALKPKINDEDFLFLQELELLREITQKVANGAITPDNVVDFFWFQFKSLHALTDFHGVDSAATREAKMLLGETLMKLNDAFKKAYDGDVLVAVITSDSSHTRRTRSLLEDNVVMIDQLNIADSYTADYPVIFNIIFWFTIVFIFSLIAITYVIGDMDPGRDSIIYRMTSNRMKKDN